MRLLKEKYIWALILLSTVVRIYAWYFTPVVGRDAFDFVSIARRFAEGDFITGLQHPFHPLYSLLISFVSQCGFELILAGRIVSLVLSILTVVVLYVVGEKMFNKTIALIAAFILAIHPYAVRLAVDVMSESTYFFFYVTGFGLGYIAIKTKRPYIFFLTGLFSAFAYLTRPEGVSILLITGLWPFVQFVKSVPVLKNFGNRLPPYVEKRAILASSIKSISLLLVGFFLLAAPYIFCIKGETGGWTLTKKKRLSQITGVELLLDVEEKSGSGIEQNKDDGALSSTDAYIAWLSGQENLDMQSLNADFDIANALKYVPEKSYSKTLYNVVWQYIDSLHYPLLLFLIIGIVCLFRKPGGDFLNIYILVYIAIFLFVLFFLRKSNGYASYRHLMNIVLVTLFWVAIGLNRSYFWVVERGLARKRAVTVDGSNWWKCGQQTMDIRSRGFIVLLCILSLLILPKTLKPHRTSKIVRKEAGLWLKDYDPGNKIVLTDKLVVALYADASGIELPINIIGYDKILKFAWAFNADYVVFTDSIENTNPGFFSAVIKSDLKKLTELNNNDRKVVVYEVVKNVNDRILDEWGDSE